MRERARRRWLCATIAVHLYAYANGKRAPEQCAADAHELLTIAGQHLRWPAVDYVRPIVARRTYATLKHYPGLALKLSAPQMIKGLPSHPDGFQLVQLPDER